MTAREEIAEAASTVSGVHVTPYFRQLTKAGEGFVSMGPRQRGDNGFGYVVTWIVLVALPQDLKAAEVWLDANLEPLMAAIDTEILVQSATPDTFTFRDGATTNAVAITGVREA